MKVDGLDIDVGVEGVLFQEDCTTCVVGHVEAIREKLVVNVVRRLFQGNEMPLSYNLFFKGIFFSPSGSRVPVVDAESPLDNRTGRKALTGTVLVRSCNNFRFWRETPRNLLALSSLGFSIAHFCCSLRLNASVISFQISGHKVAGLKVVCFLISLSPTMWTHLVVFSFNKENLVKPVHVSDHSRSPSTCQKIQGSICRSGNVDIFQWNWE